MNENENKIGKIATFFLPNGFHYLGKVISETETHYRIFDFKKQKEFDLPKALLTAEWHKEKGE